jgi:hypothetical protein
MTDRNPAAPDRTRAGYLAGSLALLAALAALIGIPSRAPASDPPGPCNAVLDRSDADATLDGLTPGFIEREGEEIVVHPWPERNERVCLWAGKFGILILKLYKWNDRAQRTEFAKSLCAGNAKLCSHAKIVRGLRDPDYASLAYFVALRTDGKEVGNPYRIPGLKWSYWLDPRKPKLGSDAWGPRGNRVMLEFSCLANDPAEQGKPQNKCVVNAMQRADLNY